MKKETARNKKTGKSVGLTVKTAIKAGGYKTINHNTKLIDS
jgi:hypothetical protein